MTKILIMAAGTGGHIFPALAVADRARELGCEIAWLGTATGLENQLITRYPLHRIAMRGVRYRSRLQQGIALLTLLRSVWQSYRLLRRIKPDVVIGFGGYVTAPGGIAAILLRKKLIIHEQNAVGGSANKLLRRFATHVFEAFPGSLRNATCVGNPVRTALATVPSPSVRYATHEGPIRILVLGGSRGAASLNTLLPECLAQFPTLVIRHQTGAAHVAATEACYRAAKLSARVDAFIEDMAEAYAWADLVICRAGALTVSELMAVGVAAVMIPFPQAVDDHQTKNAAVLVNAGAACLLPQSTLTLDTAFSVLSPLLHRDVLITMAERAYARRHVDATEIIVDACMEGAHVFAK